MTIVPNEVTVTWPDGPEEGIRYIREDPVDAKLEHFECPEWPRCECAPGTVRHDCPALKNERTA